MVTSDNTMNVKFDESTKERKWRENKYFKKPKGKHLFKICLKEYILIFRHFSACLYYVMGLQPWKLQKKRKEKCIYIYIYPIVLRYSNCYNFKISKSNTKFKNLEAIWIYVHVSSLRFTFFFFFFGGTRFKRFVATVHKQ